MNTKLCSTCNETKPSSAFYKTSGKKCKECTKEAVRRNRLDKIEYYRAYDRKRGIRQNYQYVREYREKHPNKYKATNMVNNAIRDGKLFKEPCEVCGSTERIHGHHDDYIKPLNVRWLCAAHHKQWHRDNGEAKNP